MNKSASAKGLIDFDERPCAAPSCREMLRAETAAPHERLHLHTGFAAVKAGRITRGDYRALLACLYGFYLPFEHAVGVEPLRTHWLESDLRALGVEAAEVSAMRVCLDLPRYDCPEHRLGARYVVEGSALGGRQRWRGLDALLGADAIDGRRFFAGRGAGTADAWLAFLGEIEAVGPEPRSRAALVNAAVETFERFETWLGGWSDMT